MCEHNEVAEVDWTLNASAEKTIVVDLLSCQSAVFHLFFAEETRVSVRSNMIASSKGEYKVAIQEQLFFNF